MPAPHLARRRIVLPYTSFGIHALGAPGSELAERQHCHRVITSWRNVEDVATLLARTSGRGVMEMSIEPRARARNSPRRAATVRNCAAYYSYVAILYGRSCAPAPKIGRKPCLVGARVAAEAAKSIPPSESYIYRRCLLYRVEDFANHAAGR